MTNQKKQRPNILLIVTDQEYAHQPLPAGVSLPHRARLKQQGVTFNQYQVTTTLCTPSRAAMYTGQHTPLTGMWDNDNFSYINPLSPEIPTLGHMLRAAGYYTAYKGKWHLGKFPTGQTDQDTMEPYGFADYQTWGDSFGLQAEGYRSDPILAEEAATWLKQRRGQAEPDQPWLLAVNFINPHDIMFFRSGQDHILGRIPLVEAPDDPLYQQIWPTELPPSFSDGDFPQPAFVEAYRAYINSSYGAIPEDRLDLWHAHLNYFINCLIDVDRHIGTVLAGLTASGQADNTIVVFTSDHGEMAGAHRARQKGSLAFKELVNTPLIVKHPAGPQGVSTEAVASAIDLVPTMLSWAGVSDQARAERYPQLKGVDLTPLIFEPNQAGPRGNRAHPGQGALYTYDVLHSYDPAWRAALSGKTVTLYHSANATVDKDTPQPHNLFQHLPLPDLGRRGFYRGVFDGRYKLVRYFSLTNYHQPQTVAELFENNDVGLYDLETDPDEMINLADPSQPPYDESLLVRLNEKLNYLIQTEMGQDEALVALPES